MNRIVLSNVAAVMVLLWEAAAYAVPTPAQKCEAAKLAATGKYGACRLGAEKKSVLKGDPPDYTKCDIKIGTAWSKAETKYGVACPTSGDQGKVQERVTGDAAAATAELGGGMPTVLRRLPASGQTTSYGAGDDGLERAGAALNFTDNADGTITDHTTALMWEKKVKLDATVDAANLHDADNCYPWSGMCAVGGAACGVDADCGVNAPCQAGDCQMSSPAGLTIFQWVGQLNTANFAGHNDWRIPNVKELQSIMDYEVLNPSVSPAFQGLSCGVVCIDITNSACSCTKSAYYWSSATLATTPSYAWFVSFGLGFTNYDSKGFSYYGRAVRGGL